MWRLGANQATGLETDVDLVIGGLQVPKGKYAIVVLQLTGQNWRVPNELNPLLNEVTGFTGIESQAFVLTVE